MENGVFNDLLFADDDDDESGPIRRPYTIPTRTTVNKWDDVEFFQRFRLTKPTFFKVLQLVAPALQHPYPRPRYLTPEQKLLITLRFMASGSVQLIAADCRVSTATACNVLPDVCMALIAHLHTFVKMPTTNEELRTAAANFYKFARFPQTIGAIDCLHIKLQPSGGQLSEEFRNRKGEFSLNVQTVSSSDLKIINIVARWPGSAHDQTVFQESRLCRRFESGEFGNYILVGDSAYANTEYLATPFTENNLELEDNPHMQAYQRAIISTRSVVERQYGVWKRRFPVLAYGIRLKLQTAMKIIPACAILHNIAIDAGEGLPPGPVHNEEAETGENIELNQPEHEDPAHGKNLARNMILAEFEEKTNRI